MFIFTAESQRASGSGSVCWRIVNVSIVRRMNISGSVNVLSSKNWGCVVILFFDFWALNFSLSQHFFRLLFYSGLSQILTETYTAGLRLVINNGRPQQREWTTNPVALILSLLSWWPKQRYSDRHYILPAVFYYKFFLKNRLTSKRQMATTSWGLH